MSQEAKVSGIPINITSAKLFSIDTDTLVATSTSIVRGTNDPSYFVITFSAVVVGYYRLNLYNGTTLAAHSPMCYVSEAISFPSVPPAIVPGLCNVRFLVLDRSTPIVGAKVYAELEEANPTVDTALITRAEFSGTTGAGGYVDLSMVQFSAFTRGGIYRVRVVDTLGRVIHDRRVKVPTSTTCYAEDLLDA